MKRRFEIDFIRAVSIIAVVVIHVSTLMPQTAGRTSFVIALILNQLSRFCVPAFLFVSGVLAYDSLKRRSIRDIWKRRVFDILVPYVAWTVVGLLMAPNFSIRNLLIALVDPMRGTFIQFYYIALLVQFYLLLPLIARMATKLRNVIFLCLFSVAVIGLFEVAIIYGVQIPRANELIQTAFWSWLIYFALGYLIGKHYDKFQGFIRNLSVWKLLSVTSLSVIVMLLDSYLLRRQIANTIGSQFLNFFRLEVIFYAMCATALLFKVGLTFRSSFFERLDGNSFGIYLCHVGVIIVLRRISVQLFHNAIGNIVAVILVLGISFTIVEMILHVPLIRSVFLGANRTKKTEHPNKEPAVVQY